MPNDSKTYILDDQWTDKDALDFTPYVETLADIIQTGNTPLTIGVFGTWGSGKTSLMRMIKKQLPNDFTVAWFDAWKYEKEETLWRAFLLNVLLTVEERSGETEELKSLKTMLYRGLELEKTGGVTIDLAKLGAKVAEGAIRIGLSFIPPLATLADMAKELQKSGAGNAARGFEDAIQRERTKIYVEQVRSIEQFQDKFATLIKSYISPNRLVVFVDDLDRCLPEKSIQVLEAIKLFLDVKDCVFVLGVDQDVIARGIEMKYKEFRDKIESDGQSRFTIDGIKYLEKIIQLPFQIPPVEQTDIGNFVYELSAEWPDEECPRVFSEGLGDNPRKIKRTVNVFLMLWNLANKRKDRLQGRIKPIRLAKVVAIQAVYPDLYNLLLKDEPRYLRELEEYYQLEVKEAKLSNELKSMSIEDLKLTTQVLRDVIDLQEKMQQDKPSSTVKSKSYLESKKEPPPALVPFLSQRGAAAIRRILILHGPEVQDANFADLPPDEIKLYFTLTARAEAPQAMPGVEVTSLIFEPQMVRIPAGKFLMGSTSDQIIQAIRDGADKDWIQNETPQHTVDLSEYYIGKYPITNREYHAFVRDVNYPPPRGWGGDQFPTEKGGHPVVYVSWDDATAYCKWLSTKSGKPYRLPTEAEWEKAARGEDGRVFPWGNEFDPNKANMNEANIGDTSDVGNFSPYGDSPYDCADMSGNVGEWCNDWFNVKEYESRSGKFIFNPQGPEQGDYHVLRGGTYADSRRRVRCACRWETSHSRSKFYGFRVAFSYPKGENND